MARFGAGGPSAGFGSRTTGSSSQGGSSNMASSGRSTPGSPNAADGRRGASMGVSGGSARDASNATTNPGRPGGESGERSLTPSGGESIRGSSNARTSFDGGRYAVTNPVTAQESYRARDMGELAGNPTDPVVSGSFIGAEGGDNRFSFSPNVRDSDRSSVSTYNNKSVEARARAKNLARDAADMGLGGQVVTGLAGMVLGPIGGLMAESVRNNLAAGELSDNLQQVAAETDYSLNANRQDLANALNTESVNNATFGLLGDTEKQGIVAATMAPQPAEGEMDLTPADISAEDARQLAQQGRMSWSSPNRPDGSSNIEPEPSVPAETESTGLASRYSAGDVGNYASYARNVFSTV